MKAPFDSRKLFRLMHAADLSLVVASTRHNARYLAGGYCYHFHAHSTRMARSQYLPFVGLPLDRPEEAFYVGRAEERGQIEAEGLWIPGFVEAVRGTLTAAAGLAAAIRRLGLAEAGLGLEIPFLPADVYLYLREELPKARLVDATPVFEELRAVKSPAEIELMAGVYDRTARAIQAAFVDSRAGDTTAEIAGRVGREMARRDVSFLFALVCAGPGFLRAPSSEQWNPGRVLHIDAGGEERDYIADICRMGCLGKPSSLADELLAACLEVQDAVRAGIRPGLPCCELLERGEQAARGYEFSSYSRFVVHGIGMVPYEQPTFIPRNTRPLEAGMVLSIETDFLHPAVGHVKIEDAVAVTETGCRGLGDLGREWRIL